MFRLRNATQVNRLFLNTLIREGDRVVDATLGKGNDALYLLSLTGPSGKLYGFDIQAEAIAICEKRLLEAGHDNFELFCKSHAQMTDYLDPGVDFVIFNLGYLPSFDKTVTTLAASTLKALKAAFDLLKIGGMIMVTVYPGHENGKVEAQVIDQMTLSVDQRIADVLEYSFVNQKNAPPYTYIIEKKKEGNLINEDSTHK